WASSPARRFALATSGTSTISCFSVLSRAWRWGSASPACQPGRRACRPRWSILRNAPGCRRSEPRSRTQTRRRRTMKLRLLTVAAALTASFAATTAFAQVELKFGHVGEPGSLFAASAEEFAKRANAKLGGKAKVVVYGSSQLGGDKELLQKLKLGTVDLALPSTVMSSEADLFGVFEMPYLVKDREHMKRIEKEVFWKHLAPAAEKKGLKVIAVWENGYRHITNSKRPINTPADLQGIKLRTPEGKWRVKMFQTYGANPSPMKFSEVFTALQTGVMDGQENPFTQIYSA